MSKLHELRDKLIDIIVHYTFTKEKKESILNPLDTPETPSLGSLNTLKTNESLKNELEKLILKSTGDKYSDERNLLTLLLNTILQLDLYTRTNACLTTNQMEDITHNLVSLFSTLNQLTYRSQTAGYVVSHIRYPGFLKTTDSHRYSGIGELITENLKVILDIVKEDTEIPHKVNLLVEAYQNEVETKNFRETIDQLNAKIQELKIDKIESNDFQSNRVVEQLKTENEGLKAENERLKAVIQQQTDYKKHCKHDSDSALVIDPPFVLDRKTIPGLPHGNRDPNNSSTNQEDSLLRGLLEEDKEARRGKVYPSPHGASPKPIPTQLMDGVKAIFHSLTK